LRKLRTSLLRFSLVPRSAPRGFSKAPSPALAPY